jgi:hypothetical protein
MDWHRKVNPVTSKQNKMLRAGFLCLYHVPQFSFGGLFVRTVQ